MSHQTRPTRQLDEEKPPLIFISHDSRDRQLAQAFATLIRSVTSGKLKCFRSSDDSGTEGIEFGKGWFRSLEQQLDDATDVVCLLTERSVERPWILFEAGAARGRNLHGVVFGAHDISSSPFNCIQLCEAGEASVKKLIRQLCEKEIELAPDHEVDVQIKQFMRKTTRFLSGRGRTTWRRTAPVGEKLSPGAIRRVGLELDDLRRTVRQYFLKEREKSFRLKEIRANVTLPDCRCHERSQFPGQLYFLTSRPHDGYSKQELSNRFSPGEGVCGKVYLESRSFAEDGRAGVSANKLKRMHKRLSAVAGFPLLDGDQNAFGVVSIDFVSGPDVDDDDLASLLDYGPTRRPMQLITKTLSPSACDCFQLIYTSTL